MFFTWKTTVTSDFFSTLMDFDYKQAALDLAAATNSLSHRLYKLSYLHVLDQESVIEPIKAEAHRVNVLKKKIWNMREAENVINEMDDDIYSEILDWLETNKIMICSTRAENVFIAVENGWEMYSEPPDLFGEPPLTMNEIHENARKEKMEAWAK